jgi:hypothetical protein
VGRYTFIWLYDEMLADLNSSRTNKVGETVARTVIGRQAPTKSRLFTGNSQFSVDCRSAPHRFYHGPLRSSPAVDDTFAGTRVRESGAQRGCLDLWGDSTTTDSIGSSFVHLHYSPHTTACLMHVTQSQLHARTYETTRSMIRKRRYGASTHRRGGLTRAMSTV